MTTTTVQNVAPTVSVGSNATIDEGNAFSRAGSFTDPGTQDTWTATVDYGDGSGVQSLTLNPDKTFALDHVYGDNGVYTVTVSVSDDDSGTGTGTLMVTVLNVAPAVVLSSDTTTAQYSDPITVVTVTASDVPADLLNASASFNFNGGAFTPGVPQGLAFSASSGGWTLAGKADVAPGNYIVRVSVSDDDGASTNADIAVVVLREDARVTYVGPLLVSTPTMSSSVATVELRAVIQDITAVLPSEDADGGLITNALVTFINRDTNTVIAANVPVDLLAASDTLTGIALANWVVDLGNADSQSFTIGIIVNGYYSRDSSTDNTVVTVSKPLNNSITGGGYLINEDSAGTYAGDDGLRTNFGFNVKYNKKLTNLQGHFNLIIRQDGVIYQAKANAMLSLAVDPIARTATFVSKANLQDISDPYNPISLGGNLSLVVTLTDPGEPGSSDTIGLTLWRGTELLYSSHWNGVQTIEQFLDGGNAVIHKSGDNLEAADVAERQGQAAAGLTYDLLKPVAEQGMTLWSPALDATRIQELNDTRFVIADLPGNELGLSLGNTVWVDADAAGLGWSVGDSPAARDARTVDLITVIAHELGHILGFEHSEADGVMRATLTTGTRALPWSFVDLPDQPLRLNTERGGLLPLDLFIGALGSKEALTPHESPAAAIPAWWDASSPDSFKRRKEARSTDVPALPKNLKTPVKPSLLVVRANEVLAGNAARRVH
jgi:hypothetical protein